MKKIIALTLTVLMAVAVFAACAPAAPAGEPSMPVETAEESAIPSVEGDPAAGESHLDQIKAAGKLIMLTNAEFAPYEYLGSTNEVEGIDVDICQAIADEIGVELEVVNMDFDGTIPALLGGKGDLIAAGMTVDPERAKSVDFSDPYANAKQLIVVTKENPKVSGIDDLAGKTIGVQLGTTGDLYVSQNVEGANLKQYKVPTEAGLDLVNGKLDAIVIDKLPAENLAASNDKLQTIEMSSDNEEYAIAMLKDDTELAEVVNKVIKQLKDSGKIEEFTTKHVEASKVK